MDRIHARIVALFAQDRPLPEILEETARLGAQLLMQAALGAEVTEFLGRDRYQRADAGGRQWEDARKYGFISAGGDAWYSRTLRNVPVGARVNVCIPQRGYVAVGEVTGPAQRFDSAELAVDGHVVRLADQQLIGTYEHGADGMTETDDMAEWVVPVRWHTAVPVEQAYWEKGMFANQNSACKLRQEFTLERLAQRFGLRDAE